MFYIRSQQTDLGSVQVGVGPSSAHNSQGESDRPKRSLSRQKPTRLVVALVFGFGKVVVFPLPHPRRAVAPCLSPLKNVFRASGIRHRISGSNSRLIYGRVTPFSVQLHVTSRWLALVPCFMVRARIFWGGARTGRSHGRRPLCLSICRWFSRPKNGV